MTDAPDPLQERIASIRRKFVDSLGDRLRTFEMAFDAVTAATRGGESELRYLTLLHEQAHKLAGTAGMFGYHKLSQTSLATEHKCAALLAEGRMPTPAELDEIGALVRSLRADANPSGAS